MHPRISVHGLSGSTSTLREDLDFWASAGIDNVGIPMSKLDAAGRDPGIKQVLAAGLRVCAEVQNFWVEYDLERTIREGIDLIDLVQISDWIMTDSAVPPNRAVIGDGDIPLEKIIDWFLKAGYQGAFDIELVGPRIDSEGYQSAVTRSVSWLTATLDRLGA